MPLVCNYYLTLRCNARCSFCDLWARPERELADRDTVVENLRQLPGVGVRIVDFTGGEPLLHPDLPLFLQTARNLKLRTTVTTNGLLYPQRARELAGKVNLLHFSLDGADSATHDRQRGLPSFDRVIESLELARSLGEKPELLFTASRENYRDVTRLADLSKRLGLILIVNPVFGYPSPGGPVADEHLLSREELIELVGLCRRPYVYLNGGVVRLMLEGGNDSRKPRCKAVSATVVISPDDRLLLPCFHHEQEAIPIAGNLKQALDDPRRLNWLSKQGRAGFCQGCSINCYLAPSLPYRLDRYLVSFLPWMVKYFYYKSRRPRCEVPRTNPPTR
jgi:MoaA/NifB/PqqE/SkfB family radical SAM enzyme